MRDALSVLDQLSALSDKGIDAGDVFSMLGMVEIEFLFDLTDALIARSCVKAMEIFNQIIERGKDIKQLGKDLTEHFRHLMIVKVGGVTLDGLIDYPAGVKQRLAVQAEKITIAGILRAIELFIEAQETARVMETWRMPLEVAFAKLTYGGSTGVLPSSPSPASSVSVKSSGSVAFQAAVEPSAPHAVRPVLKVESLEDIKTHWNALTQEISRRKMALATYLQEGSPCELKSGRLVIGFAKESSFAQEFLNAKENIKLIEDLFSERLGGEIFVTFKTVDKSLSAPKQEEPVVKAALEMFRGKVVKQWPNEQK
jgi:DNA polymerase-3 subunit gamma/tau